MYGLAKFVIFVCHFQFMQASELMKSHAKPLLSVSLMHSTVRRFNAAADLGKLTYGKLNGEPPLSASF